MKKNKATVKTEGISVNTMVIPMIVVIAVMLTAIVALLIAVNINTQRRQAVSDETSTQKIQIDSLKDRVLRLSSYADNYVNSPTTKTGMVNWRPVHSYAVEIADGDAADFLDMFEEYKYTSADIRSVAVRFATHANYLIKAQLHAIALVNSTTPLPDTEFTDVPDFKLPELTKNEVKEALPQREADARTLIIDRMYKNEQDSLVSTATTCKNMIDEYYETITKDQSSLINILRIAMELLAIGILIVLVISFITIYRSLIKPMRSFVQIIAADSDMDERKGFQEIRLVAKAYNKLLDRREALEGLLRTAAETDALTGLSNRYGMEKYFLEAGKSGYSLGMILFDVNFLKKTNDTLGHAAGDKLIKDAGECISSSFSGAGECTWYRFGGDEFAAVVKGADKSDIDAMVERFKKTQQEMGISVSWGYSFVSDFGKTTLKNMMDEADQKMYQQKMLMHKELAGR